MSEEEVEEIVSFLAESDTLRFATLGMTVEKRVDLARSIVSLIEGKALAIHNRNGVQTFVRRPGTVA